MRSWSYRSGFGLLAALVLLASRSAANDPAPGAALSPAAANRLQQITTLIRQLGSESFRERERASRELLDLGIETREALSAVVNNPDAEVRARARAILAVVSESDFRDRLEAFSSDYDGSHKQTLPGWQRFSGQLGATRQARQLFVEMQRAEPELLEAYAKGGKIASDLLDKRCRVLLQQLTQVSTGDGPVSVGTVATLLLVGSSEDVTIDEQLAFQLYSWVIYRPAFQKNATSGMWAGIMKKLLGMWIVKDISPAATVQNLIFAGSYELKPEGLSLATKLLASENTTPQIRQFALLSIGRFGGKEQVATVEKFLADANNCGAIQTSRPPRQLEVQVRDVALAVLVHLTGQAARDYGTPPEPNPQTYLQIAALTFPTAASREVALKRWQQWRAEHPQP